MGKEILNRRQNILADSIPPEITDTSSFIEATDYATSTTGGTVKVDSTYAIELTSGGKLKAKEISAAGYSDANDAAFISKATLDNVLAAQPSPQGFTETELFKGSSVLTTDQDLTDKIANYKILACVFADNYDEHFTIMVPVALVTLGTTVFNGCIGTSYLINFKFVSGDTVDAVHKQSVTGNVTLKAVYGYK